MLLKKAHLAHAFGGDAARGHVGHRTSREFQACMGNIDLIRQHRNSHRLHFRDRLFQQRKQDVQVVNHQIVDHVHVEAARREHPQPVHLEK